MTGAASPKGFFETLVDNGLLITVATLIIAVLGIVAAVRIPIQMIPDLEVRTVSVVTSWPGATPQDVEKEILIEQEEYLRTVPNLRRLEATASSGFAEIELDFPFGVDMTETLIRVNNALNQVPSYPINVDEPRVFASSFSANSFMYFHISPLAGNPRELDMDMMRDFVEDNVRTRMTNVPGVSDVSVRGGAERQIQILLDPVRLADRGLSITAVRDAIRRRNQDVSGGEIDSGKRRYLLRTVGRFDDIEKLQDLIVDRRGDTLIRLGDVARIELDHFEIRNLSYVNGDPVVSLAVSRETGSNVIDIKYGMLDAVDQINEDVLFPAGMEMGLIAEDAGYVEASVRNVWVNLTLGALLATLVMFLFLRSAKATAVGIIGIPICTIAAFLGLLAAGRTINVISLAGVAFAIGMTLDNSIVVIESIELARRRGLSRIRSAVEGVRNVWPAVLASTLTTILVFAPVLFIVEEAGQLYSDIAIAISASILASMFVAISLIPTASARLDFGTDDHPVGGRFRDAVLKQVDRMTGTPGRRNITIASTVLLSLAVIVFLTPAAEYLPEGEEPKTFAVMSAPPGYNLETMTAIGLEIQERFLPYVGDDPGRFNRGETDVPALKYLNLSINPNRIRIISEPLERRQIGAVMDAITGAYESYPGMRAFAARGSIISSNDGGTRSINLDISGANLSVIYDVAMSTYRRAQDVFGNPRIQSSPSSLALAQPLIEIRPELGACGRARNERRRHRLYGVGVDGRGIRRRVLPGRRQGRHLPVWHRECQYPARGPGVCCPCTRRKAASCHYPRWLQSARPWTRAYDSPDQRPTDRDTQYNSAALSSRWSPASRSSGATSLSALRAEWRDSVRRKRDNLGCERPARCDQGSARGKLPGRTDHYLPACWLPSSAIGAIRC